LTHAPPHEVKPVEHSSTQLPAEQDCPVVHVVAQAPQFLRSLLMSTQVPAQSVLPLGQRQSAWIHALPAPQVVPQCPQFLISDPKSTQAWEQFAKGALQSVVQAPDEHTSLPVHAVAQAPQCVGLVMVLTHVPPQSIFPTSQMQAPPEHTLPPAQVVPQARSVETSPPP